MHPLRLTRLLLLSPLLCGGGCCSLARLFCGPDTSDWEQIAYDTPPQTLATFLAALRRDNIEQVRRCLTGQLQDKLGFSTLSETIVRERLHRDFPYLYMVGYTPVPEKPVGSNDGVRTYAIETHGKQVRLELVRQMYTRVVYAEKDDDELCEAGDVLSHDSWNGRAVLQPAARRPEDANRSTIDLGPIGFEHGSISSLPLEHLHLVALGREWKIDDIRVLE